MVFRHLVHLQTTLSHSTPITREQRPGFSKEGRTRGGQKSVVFVDCGNICHATLLVHHEYDEWKKSTGSDSLLWIHGKCAP